MRFFRPLKKLPHPMLARFTQSDYDREIAMVALTARMDQERLLGVARMIQGRNPKEAEFAIAVSDVWQGKGIGAVLLGRSIAIARERNIEKVFGSVLAENSQMLALGRKMGLKVQKVKGAGGYERTLNRY